jgi:hypothetical protein
MSPKLQKYASGFCLILLYYDTKILHSWPSSDILIILAKKAIKIILRANAIDTYSVAEMCKYLISLLKELELIYNYHFRFLKLLFY